MYKKLRQELKPPPYTNVIPKKNNEGIAFD